MKGSMDGNTWTDLRVHENDQTMCKAGQFASWPITAANALLPFRFFRLVLTGPTADTSTPWNFCICYLELYGYFRWKLHCYLLTVSTTHVCFFFPFVVSLNLGKPIDRIDLNGFLVRKMFLNKREANSIWVVVIFLQEICLLVVKIKENWKQMRSFFFWSTANEVYFVLL